MPNEDYGDEEDGEGKEDEDDKKPKDKPIVPIFNKDEFIKKWLEENPVIERPHEAGVEVDCDWILTAEEEQALVSAFL